MRNGSILNIRHLVIGKSFSRIVIALKNVSFFFFYLHRLEDVYLGMVAKRLNITIQNYVSYYLLQMPPWEMREKSIEEKTRLFSKTNVANVYFLYETNGKLENFSQQWIRLTKWSLTFVNMIDTTYYFSAISIHFFC